MEHHDQTFELYDLAVVVEAINGHCTCEMTVGDRFFVRGGKIALPDRQSFCMYAMQAVMPLLPAKQRPCHPADWMETDTRATCPDPRADYSCALIAADAAHCATMMSARCHGMRCTHQSDRVTR